MNGRLYGVQKSGRMTAAALQPHRLEPFLENRPV